MIYDITQELFSCQVFPGDPAPRREVLKSTERGDLYTLSALSLCAHNGTHIDAPAHFIPGGRTVEALPPETFMGPVWVADHRGDLTAADAERILADAGAAGAGERILIRGRAVVTAAAARVFAASGLLLLGNESQTVGPEDAPMEVHLILLGAGAVLLEGVRLGAVPQGRYRLIALPLRLEGCEGSPCRAVLTDGEDG
jgi:arylformamidase